MSISRSVRPYVCAAALLALLPVRPAAAQYAPAGTGNAATGETYHIEFGAGLWNPTPTITISSESLGIIGSNIDFVTDLGVQQTRFPEFNLVLRPARKHKFRISYIPIKYQSQATLTRDIVFNGIKYTIGLPVTSTLDWKAWRFGYEYDFISRDRGFAGVIAEAKYTEVTATVASAVDTEYTQAKAPIPAVGGIVRVYVVPNISITGEATGFKLPGSIQKGDSGQYIDIDIYGTVNFTNNIGAQVGWRSLDVQYSVNTGDSGDFTLRGLYFGAVARF
ncbi:MAG TPA: hypothetical protein VND92_02105 [Vicinamibacterales bacterium]|nr:hypothetical protein [Vicinamibacterales bacterium]